MFHAASKALFLDTKVENLNSLCCIINGNQRLAHIREDTTRRKAYASSSEHRDAHYEW